MLAISGGVYAVLIDEEELECSLRGRVKRDSEAPVSVGDLVHVERLDDGSCRISEALPRHSSLNRHGVARRREQVIAANIDQVAAVASVAHPDPDFAMIDRLLALAELNGIVGFLVVNKSDLVPELTTAEDVQRRFRPYREAGYDVLVTSTKTGDNLEELRSRLRDRITVLSGSSGVGKSSLLNALMPGLDIRIGEVGERKRRGRHTTVAARLYPLPEGGFVADTPGLQYLALWDVDTTSLSDAFPELRPYAAECRFGDCHHMVEPGCAVTADLEAGEIDRRRYDNYVSLLDEATEGR